MNPKKPTDVEQPTLFCGVLLLDKFLTHFLPNGIKNGKITHECFTESKDKPQ
jgi:hypothetical protein